MADLSGKLSAFALPRMLELLRDEGTSGEMMVTGEDFRGRILVRDGRIAYATTASGSDTVAELDSLLRGYEAGGEDDGLRSLEDVLLEQLTDVIYDLAALESGAFEVEVSPTLEDEYVYSFAVDDVLGRVEARVEEWKRIREVIPSDDAVFRLASRLPGESDAVTFDAPTWRLLAAIGGGASISDVTASDDSKRIHTARAFADLVGRGLIEVSSQPARVEPPATEIIKMEDEPEVPESQPDVPRLDPAEGAVTFAARDLNRDEIDDVIRNIGRGIFPG